MTRIAVLPASCTSGYVPHELHGPERIWVEKNCYVDIWIELIHALKLDPVAVMPFVVAIDFDDDQWTFYKPPHEELQDLYGIGVQELNVWRPLVQHAEDHLRAGRFISTEADAYWLPDTSGTDYRSQHTKTTIVLDSIDVEARELGYFHNASYHRLAGEDFEQLFRIGLPANPEFMPLFAELVRVERLVRRPSADLAAASLALLKRHLGLRPASNPILRFRDHFLAGQAEFRTRGLPYYHAWAFGATRQLGGAFELASIHARWLGQHRYDGFEPAAAAFEQLSALAKTFILKAARCATSNKPLDFSTTFSDMATAWERGIDAADAAVRRSFPASH